MEIHSLSFQPWIQNVHWEQTNDHSTVRTEGVLVVRKSNHKSLYVMNVVVTPVELCDWQDEHVEEANSSEWEQEYIWESSTPAFLFSDAGCFPNHSLSKQFALVFINIHFVVFEKE